jgi:hypothetical protein
MAIIGLHFAAQPAQVQNRVDLAQEMIVRNHLFQIEVIEKTILSTNRLAHHRRDPSAQTFMSKESKGRDFSAWLGLVPRQMSTGGRTILGRISKRGNSYLRTLFIRGARVILLRPENWSKHSFGPWLEAASRRLHRNVLAVALANKLARIAWSVLAGERHYEARRTAA